MRYFKIIQNKKVVDVSFAPLRWSEKYFQMVGCDVERAQFVQGYITGKTFRDGWMRHTEAPDVLYDEADVIETTGVEFNDLYETLHGGEEIEVEPDEPLIPVVPEAHIEETEKPMSVSEMRQVIQDQQQQIDLLKEMIEHVVAGK